MLKFQNFYICEKLGSVWSAEIFSMNAISCLILFIVESRGRVVTEANGACNSLKVVLGSFMLFFCKWLQQTLQIFFICAHWFLLFLVVSATFIILSRINRVSYCVSPLLLNFLGLLHNVLLLKNFFFFFLNVLDFDRQQFLEGFPRVYLD